MSAQNMTAMKLRKKKNVKKGIQFCLMVCGTSGTGRTTFVNTLCGRPVLASADHDDPSTAHLEEGVRIKPVTVELELDEEGTRVSLTIVDTPGFGDSVDNVSARSPASSRGNTMTFSPRRAASSVTRALGIIVCTCCCISCSRRVSHCNSVISTFTMLTMM